MSGSGRGEMGRVRRERERSVSLGRRGRDDSGSGRGLAPSSSRGSIRSWLDRGNTREAQASEQEERRSAGTSSARPMCETEAGGSYSSQIPGTPATGADRNKRTVMDRSPQLGEECRNQQPRLNVFDLGEAFSVLDESMRRKMEEVTSKAPEEGVDQGSHAGGG